MFCGCGLGCSLDNSSRMMMLVYLVHLLDFEWQEYDHTLLNELELPEFLYHSSVSKCSPPLPLSLSFSFSMSEME